MDKASMRPKPIPPPKPASRLSGQKEEKPLEMLISSKQHETGFRVVSSGHICNEIPENNSSMLLTLNNKTDGSVTASRAGRHVVEGNGGAGSIDSFKATHTSTATQTASILSPKPALLPKPQTHTNKPMSPQSKLPSFRPTVPRRPEKKELSEESSTQTSSVVRSDPANSSVGCRRSTKLPHLNPKAPVAELDEFDDWGSPGWESPCSPTRPPRSPKTKSFLEGPFEKLDERPELPIKKRLLSTAKDGGKNLEYAKKRSSSLGRSGNTNFLQGNDKSGSLGRNLSCSEQLTTSLVTNIGPVPPPRRRNKSEELPRLKHFTEISLSDPNIDNKANVPIYAAVNYDMKKNRRTKADQKILCPTEVESQTDNQHCTDEVESIIEGRLILLGKTEHENNNCVPCIEETALECEIVKIANQEVPQLVDECGSDETFNCSALPDGPLSSDKHIPVPSDLFETFFIEETLSTKVSPPASDENKDVNLKLDSLEVENCSIDDSSMKWQNNSMQVDTERAGETLTPNASQLHRIVPVSCSNTSDLQQLSMCENVERVFESNYKPKFERNLSELHRIMQDNKHGNIEMTCDSAERLPDPSQSSKPEDNLSQVDCAMQIDARSGTKERICDNVKNELIHNDIDMCSNVSLPVLQNITEVTDQLSKDIELHKEDNSGLTFRKYDSSSLSERPVSTCELPEISDLVIVGQIKETLLDDRAPATPLSIPSARSNPASSQMGTQLWRRQSWSSSKDTTPSPERGLSSSVRKQKHQKHGPWCDEGELSNGALADSDTGSSDNTGKLFLDDVNPVRNKITAWFDSFGKGGKKRNKERKPRTSSQFYNEDENAFTCTQPAEDQKTQILRPAPEVPVASEYSRETRLSSELDIMLCEPGTECKSDAAFLDGSFKDSESENEDDRGDTLGHQSKERRKERKVFLIAQELMTSEKEFVDVLKLLNVHFSEAVNAAGTQQNPIIPKSDFSKIINSLPQLQSLNEDLLRDLESRIENWSSFPKIADVIVRKGPFLKLYSSYIQNFESQCNYLDDCCQRYPRFSKVVKDFEASPCCRKLNVKHFMLKPVQRIPQYRLLLENYLRHLNVDSLDFQDTEEALRIVRDVADHANRSFKLGDHLSKLIDLQSQLSNYEIIKPGRQFVKDGELFKLSRKGRHPRYFILLNDCLLYTSKSNNSLLRVNNELPLNGMKVNLPQVEDYNCEFSIISVTRSFTISASSKEEREEWIDALQNAIKDHTERQRTFQLVPTNITPPEPFKVGQQAPVWIQDRRVTMCQSCTTQFTVMFRRHHCRACGKVVCGVCSDNRAPLRYMKFEAARVCEECHDTLLQEFEDPESNIIQIIMSETGSTNVKETTEAKRGLFKKSGAGGKKKIMLLKKDIPQRLKEVAANDSGSQMSGWLQRRGRRSWKRLWFVLKEQVLYVYKASEDVVALESIPVLGYKVEPLADRHFQIYEGIDAKLVFQLAHSGQLPLVFYADNEHMATRWMLAMQEATVLM